MTLRPRYGDPPMFMGVAFFTDAEFEAKQADLLACMGAALTPTCG